MTIDEIVVAGEPGAWRAAGFEVEGDVCRVGTVALRLAGEAAGRRIVSWSLRGLGGDGDLDGLPTAASERPPAEAAGPHPNGVTRIDHVVAFTPQLERTLEALQAAGLDLRRVREGPTHGREMRQGFFRLGEVILEVVDAPEGSPLHSRPDAPARFWGLAFVVEDFGAAGSALGEQLSEPRDAVQPGRRIATVRESARLGPAVALMTSGPAAA